MVALAEAVAVVKAGSTGQRGYVAVARAVAGREQLKSLECGWEAGRK